MTKEELIDKIKAYSNNTSDNIAHDVYEFFESNVVIPKGVNRHPYAEILHEWIEGAELEFKFNNEWQFRDDVYEQFSHTEYRIKPQEPIYEYKVRMVYSDGTCECTEKYFTIDEYNEFGFPKTCTIEDTTRRERK